MDGPGTAVVPSTSPEGRVVNASPIPVTPSAEQAVRSWRDACLPFHLYAARFNAQFCTLLPAASAPLVLVTLRISHAGGRDGSRRSRMPPVLQPLLLRLKLSPVEAHVPVPKYSICPVTRDVPRTRTRGARCGHFTSVAVRGSNFECWNTRSVAMEMPELELDMRWIWAADGDEGTARS